MKLYNKNGVIYDVIAESDNDFLVRSSSGHITLAIDWDAEQKEWSHSYSLGEGNEAIAIGMVMLVERKEHSEDFAKHVFKRLSYNEQFDAVMSIESCEYEKLTEKEKAKLYELYYKNGHINGMINNGILELMSMEKDEELEF